MNRIATDPERVKKALYDVLSATATAEKPAISANFFISNRPKSTVPLDSFVVLDVNGPVVDYANYARCVCSVALFARDVDQSGTEDMTLLTAMYDALLKRVPADTGAYTFTKRNQAGKHDTLGFHCTVVNLDCLIS